jgi:ketosteroid isomerase-like protein
VTGSARTASTPNVEMTRAAYLALNRGDVDWLVQHCDPGVEMHFRGVAGEPVLYVGEAGLREYFRDMADIWDHIEYLPEDIRDLGDRTFTIVRRRLRGKESGLTLEDTVACVCALRDGAVAEIWAYRDIDDALAGARLDP